MNSTAETFIVQSTEQPLGRGFLVTLVDFEVTRYAIEVSGKITMIRPGAYAALLVLLAKVGRVVRFEEFTGLRDSVRRNLGEIRTPLEKCGFDLDVVQGVGYRLTLRNARPTTKKYHDLRIDADVLRVSCGSKSLTLPSPIDMAILMTLADGHSHDATSLYRAAYGNAPMVTVGETISRRIKNLREALDEMGSSVKIRNWFFQRQNRYVAEGPGPSMVISIDGRRYEQMAMPISFTDRNNQRRPHRHVPCSVAGPVPYQLDLLQQI